MAARRAARAWTRRASERGFPGRWFAERWFPERLDRERPDRVADASAGAVGGSAGAAGGSDRASAGAASSACDDITDRDSIPAGRIGQISPHYLTLFRPPTFRCRPACLPYRPVNTGKPSPQRGMVVGQNSRMDLGLRGRVYLVTGGSRGLGFAAAQALTGEGARVVLSAPHEAAATAAAVRLTQNGEADAVTWVAADNADPATPGLLIA